MTARVNAEGETYYPYHPPDSSLPPLRWCQARYLPATETFARGRLAWLWRLLSAPDRGFTIGPWAQAARCSTCGRRFESPGISGVVPVPRHPIHPSARHLRLR